MGSNRRLDGEEQAGAVGDGGVALADLGRGGVEKMDDVGMDLLQEMIFRSVAREGGLEAAAVLEDVFLGVPVRKAQIEEFLAVLSADAAGLVLKLWTSQGSWRRRGFEGVGGHETSVSSTESP